MQRTVRSAILFALLVLGMALTACAAPPPPPSGGAATTNEAAQALYSSEGWVRDTGFYEYSLAL